MGPTTLVGDVGGTNCRLALAERNSLGTIELHHSERFAVKDYKHFNDVVTKYLEHQDVKPSRAAFAFAGPKFDDEIRMTNVDWIVSEENLIKTFGFKEAVVLNDFVAMANGVAVMGPGTGLGVSCILPGKPPRIIPTEGGHTAFAPQTDVEIEVLYYWLKRLGYVSAETLISGPGLYRLYTALCAIWDEPAICGREDEIVAAAEANPKSIARKSAVMFCDILATFAGNTAFSMGAVGGVVLAGGVTRHISPFIAESNFTDRFQQRGHGSWFIQDIPVRLMKAHFVALYGAAAMVLEG